MGTATRAGRHRGLILAVLAAGTLALLLSLGWWQLARLAWKEALLERIAESTAAAPISLSDMERLKADGGDIDFRPVRLEGRFHHDGERHVLATRMGRPGFHVYTPMQLPNTRYIFVNRGFVPHENKAPDTRAAGQPTGHQTLEGLARSLPAGKPSRLVPDNDIESNVFYWKDLGVMAASAGLPDDAEIVPFFVDVDESPNPGGLPLGGVTRRELPNWHLQYALTWFGLAAALCAVLAVHWLRARRRP